jgi:mono/diheme cytochrome c family protein
VEFLERLATNLPARTREGGLQAAYPDTDLTSDGSSSAREKLVAEVTWYCGQGPDMCGPPRLGPEPERGLEFDAQLSLYVRELSRKQVRTVPDAIRLLRGHLLYFMRLGRLKFGTYAGPGRVDAFGVARGVLFGPEAAGVLAAPVSFPCLWEFQTSSWLHWDGNTNSVMERNIGQALGMGATVDRRDFSSSVLPRNLAELERLSNKLGAPRWPQDVFGPLEPARLERGREHFARHCQGCHDAGQDVIPLAQVGTDGNRARSFAAKVGDLEFPAALQDLLARVKQRAYAREGMTAEEIRPLEPRIVYWRAPVGYVARPLEGIWATAPYLHNGSVPTLWDLLQPASARPTRFPMGQREYDPDKVGYVTEMSEPPRFTFDVSMPGNSNAGHEYGTDLSEDEKRDLLEYLKSL